VLCKPLGAAPLNSYDAGVAAIRRRWLLAAALTICVAIAVLTVEFDSGRDPGAPSFRGQRRDVAAPDQNPPPVGYVGVLDRSGKVVGYAATTELQPSARPVGPAPIDAPIKVVAHDLNTVVGYVYSGKGFVRVGQDPDAVPSPLVTTTTASAARSAR